MSLSEALASPRVRAMVKWAGWCYVGYHVLLGSLFVVGFFVETRPGYWREPGALGELFFTVFLYPLFIPFFVVCGGLHDRCENVLGIGAQWTVLVLTVIWAATGARVVVLSFRGWWGRRAARS